jgi:hypothetical protein
MLCPSTEKGGDMAGEYGYDVEVIDLVYSDGKTRGQTFSGVSAIKVDSGGHLSLGDSSRVIAAYAPGEWKRVIRKTKES